MLVSEVVLFFWFGSSSCLTDTCCACWKLVSEAVVGTLLSLFKGTAVCTATCLQLHKKAERIASVLCDKGHLNAGDNVVLLYPPGKQALKRTASHHENAVWCFFEISLRSGSPGGIIETPRHQGCMTSWSSFDSIEGCPHVLQLQYHNSSIDSLVLEEWICTFSLLERCPQL